MSAATVGALVDRLGGDDDLLWPAPAWVPMRLDRPLAVGADGGHGPIRYWVSEYKTGVRVRFTFHPEVGIDGFHEAHTVFRGSPPWVVALLRLRNALVGLVGIERGDRSAFDMLELVRLADASGGGEALLGTDAGHLDFRASLLVDTTSRTVTLTTVTCIHNRRGRLYMAIVRRLHPPVVRAMLRRAMRRLAVRPPMSGGGLAREARPAT